MGERTVTVSIPDFAAMSDEEVASRARLLDGRWSEQTKALMAAFETTRLDLNRWWASTWQGWTCPCCRRQKRQLARLGPGGVLICKLELHHDHLKDQVSQIFRVANPHEGGALGSQVDNAKQALKTLCERFAPSLICQDCNAAEGAAKAALAGILPRDFTFTPAEVATFIRVEPNRSHEVNEAAALAAWDAAKDDFEDRLQFADLVASRFASGRHRRDTSTQSREPGFDDQYFVWSLISAQVPRLQTGTIELGLRDRSISSDSAGQTVARKKPSNVNPPSDEEFASIEADMPQGKKTWDSAGDGWKCPCCGRSKREVCRKSRRGAWSAQIHQIRDWDEEADSVSLGWREAESTSPVIVGSHHYLLICQDCRNITTKLRQRTSGFGEECLTVADLIAVIAASGANQDHDVDFEEALRRAEANRNLIDAVHDYDEHRSRARVIAARIKWLMRWGSFSASKALDIAATEHAPTGYECDDAVAYVEWMLSEAKRFDAMEAVSAHGPEQRDRERAAALPATSNIAES